MTGFKERTSINTSSNKLQLFPAMLRNIVSTRQVRSWPNLSLKPPEEEVYTGSRIEWDVPEGTIWVSEGQTKECEFDVSTSLDDLIVYFLSQVLEVQQIYLLKESENLFHVWTVVSEKSRVVKNNIYEHERKLILYFKETLYFDFHIEVLSDIEDLRNIGASLIFDRN